MRSVAGQSAFGPVLPNGVIDTVTSAGLAARSASRSTGTAPHSNTHVGVGAQIGQRGLARRRVSRSTHHAALAAVPAPERQRALAGPRRRRRTGRAAAPAQPSGGSTSTTSAPSPARTNAARLPRSSREIDDPIGPEHVRHPHVRPRWKRVSVVNAGTRGLLSRLFGCCARTTSTGSASRGGRSARRRPIAGRSCGRSATGESLVLPHPLVRHAPSTLPQRLGPRLVTRRSIRPMCGGRDDVATGGGARPLRAGAGRVRRGTQRAGQVAQAGQAHRGRRRGGRAAPSVRGRPRDQRRGARRFRSWPTVWAAAVVSVSDEQSAAIGGGSAQPARAATAALREATRELADAAVAVLGNESKRSEVLGALRAATDAPRRGDGRRGHPRRRRPDRRAVRRRAGPACARPSARRAADGVDATGDRAGAAARGAGRRVGRRSADEVRLMRLRLRRPSAYAWPRRRSLLADAAPDAAEADERAARPRRRGARSPDGSCGRSEEAAAELAKARKAAAP